MGLLEALESALEVKQAVVEVFTKTTEAQLVANKDDVEVWAMKIKNKLVLVGYDAKLEVLSARLTKAENREADAKFLVEAHLKGREAKTSGT